MADKEPPPATKYIQKNSKENFDAAGEFYKYPYFYYKRRQDAFTKEVNGISFRPLGGWEYGYSDDYMCYSSWLIWALTTWGAVSNDKFEGLGILAAAMYLNESKSFRNNFIHDSGERGELAGGASWVHNVMAGYCWYHYYILKKNTLPLKLGSWSELAGDLGAVAQEQLTGVGGVSHEAHYNGGSQGMAIALILDKLRGKRTKGWGEWYKPVVALGILYFADYAKKQEYK